MEYIEFYKIAYGWVLSIGRILIYWIGLITIFRLAYKWTVLPIVQDTIDFIRKNKISKK